MKRDPRFFRMLLRLSMSLLLVVRAVCAGSFSVTLTNPPDGKLLTFPCVVRLRASIDPPQTSIQKVSFYESTNRFLGSVTNPPFNLNLTNQFREPYSYYFTAVATGDQNNSATSAPIRITVSQDIHPPFVQITAPAKGTLTGILEPVLLAAAVDADDGSENPVEFYVGQTLIGSALAPPYQLITRNLPLGTNTITARNVDSFGNAGRSSPVHVTVVKIILAEPLLLPDAAFHFTIQGVIPDRQVYIQSSSNLLVWSSIATNSISSTSSDFTTPKPTGAAYYRVAE